MQAKYVLAKAIPLIFTNLFPKSILLIDHCIELQMDKQLLHYSIIKFPYTGTQQIHIRIQTYTLNY